MFVPTRAEALGLVFLEASAFALPSIATDVGGVPEVIKSGVTGATFPLSAGPAEYAVYWKTCSPIINTIATNQLRLLSLGIFSLRSGLPESERKSIGPIEGAALHFPMMTVRLARIF